jgi:hypothetical protein
VTTPGGDATRKLLKQPNGDNEKEYTTSIEFACPSGMWFFDYALPIPFVSYYYSTNIPKAILTCNEYG